MRKAANFSDTGNYTAAKGDAEQAKVNKDYEERFKFSRRMTMVQFCKRYGLDVPACPHCGKDFAI